MRPDPNEEQHFLGFEMQEENEEAGIGDRYARTHFDAKGSRPQNRKTQLYQRRPLWVAVALCCLLPLFFLSPLKATRTSLSSQKLSAEDLEKYNMISSVSTSNGDYFRIRFSDTVDGLNPSIVAHPTKLNTWIVIATRKSTSPLVTQIACEAVFKQNTLACVSPITTLPIGSTASGHCGPPIEYFALSIGPRDARVFQGPEHPYIIYGKSQSLPRKSGSFPYVNALPCLQVQTRDTIVSDCGLKTSGCCLSGMGLYRNWTTSFACPRI